MSNLEDTVEAGSDFRDYQRLKVELSDTAKPFCRLLASGQLEWNFHLGQRRAMESKKRIVAVIAGRQSGKTACAPIWLHEEMRAKGPGLYMVVAPSYPLLMDAAVPKIIELFQTYRKLGEMRSNPLRFIISTEGSKRLFAGTRWDGAKNLPITSIRFGHAANPESLEAKTALAAVLDEAGQDGFKLASFEAIMGRLATTLGRVYIGTTPYNLGWLKQKIVDPWQKAERNHPDIDVIAFSSIMNPAFSKEEYYRLKETMPFWKWDMFYNGNFTVPAGLIYGIMKEKEEKLRIPRSQIPTVGPMYGGLDFGGPNTCAVMARKDGFTDKIYLSNTYYPGYAMQIREHVKNITAINKYYDRFVGGAKSEGQFRDEFLDNGLLVEAPTISDVQTGIDRLYGLISQEKFYVADDLDNWWSELYTYQYETDPDTGDVLPELKIKDKSGFHHLDATRYLATLFQIGLTMNGPARSGGERTNVEYMQELTNKLIGLQDANQRPSQGSVARGGSIRRGSDYGQRTVITKMPRPGLHKLRHITLDDE